MAGAAVVAPPSPALVVVIILSYCNLFVMYHQRYHIGDELRDRDGIYFQWQTD